jgi:glucan phosphoethanolaminetransferase (alkaline phosphatase superfamily)
MQVPKLLGPVAFYVGLLISVIGSFVAEPSGALYGVLAVLGIIVALLNITAKEVNMYMVSSIAFIVSFSAVQQLVTAAGSTIPTWLSRLAANLVVLVGAGVIVIALKAIYQLAKAE